jgi:hypothetical protein
MADEEAEEGFVPCGSLDLSFDGTSGYRLGQSQEVAVVSLPLAGRDQGWGSARALVFGKSHWPRRA